MTDLSPTSRPRWWRRARDEALVAARAAQGEAAAALLEVDKAQRSAAQRVDSLAAVAGGARGDRLRAAWAEVSARADAAVAGYLESVARHDAQEDLELEQALQARSELTAAAEQMRRATAAVETFFDPYDEQLADVYRALGELPGRSAQAGRELAAARLAVQQAAAAGLHVGDLTALLEQAEVQQQVVAEGAARHGLPAVLAACDQVLALASAARQQASARPGRRTWARNRVRSLRTRLDAVAARAEADSDDVLRTLHRRYVAGCWQDVQQAPAQVGAALARAAAGLDRAERAASDAEQRWDDAVVELAAVREALDTADATVDAPRRRLELLDRLAADPDAALGRARFAVRDAQKLLMSGPVEPADAARLDALSARLDRARSLLDAPHPDWLALGRELDAVQQGCADLVGEIRSARAARR